MDILKLYFISRVEVVDNLCLVHERVIFAPEFLAFPVVY